MGWSVMMTLGYDSVKECLLSKHMVQGFVSIKTDRQTHTKLFSKPFLHDDNQNNKKKELASNIYHPNTIFQCSDLDLANLSFQIKQGSRPRGIMMTDRYARSPMVYPLHSFILPLILEQDGPASLLRVG